MKLLQSFRSLLSSKLDETRQSNEAVLDFLKSCPVKVIRLSDGKPFAIVIKSDDIDQQTLEDIKQALHSKYHSSGYEVAVFGIGLNDDVDYMTMKEVLEKTDVASQS